MRNSRIPAEKRTGSDAAGHLGFLIWQATRNYDPAQANVDVLPSASELAKSQRMDLDAVKKRLQRLKNEGFIQPVSFSPKRYRFIPWQLTQLTPEDELFSVFCEEDSPYFILPA